MRRLLLSNALLPCLSTLALLIVRQKLRFTAFQELGQRLTVPEETRPISGRTLSEELRSVEHDLIKKALEESEGSITYAARSLGMTYQNLDYALKTRHKDLLKKRTPVRRRSRKQ